MAKLPLKWLPAKAHGGPFGKGAPVGVAVHSTESENTPAMAEALAGPNWFGGSKAGTSAHKVVDVDSICEGVKRTTVAYHAGAGGNVIAVAYEFCGRASWSAAKWREPGQLQMLRNAAPHIADDLRAIGAPARWLSLVQLAAVARSKRPADGGLFTHNDIRLALGGTTHSDPGPNFPYAELLAYVQAELIGTSTADPTISAPTSVPEDDMPTELPAGSHDYVLAVRPTDKHLKLVAFQGNPATINMINAMRPNAKGDVDGVGMAAKFQLPRFHGPVFEIPAGCTAVVVNYTSEQPLSAVLFP